MRKGAECTEKEKQELGEKYTDFQTLQIASLAIAPVPVSEEAH